MKRRFTVSIDGRDCAAEEGQSLLDVCRRNGIELPTLCHLDGLVDAGACRLCLVELEGSAKLLPACVTQAAPRQKIRTDSELLRRYRRLTLELFLSERSHVCPVCVADGNCELQRLAAEAGVNQARFPVLEPACELDASHGRFVLDPNRCVLCTRCVRVCDEVEGAHTWDVANRGAAARIVADFRQPWGEAGSCTSCGKCVECCPTGALWPKGAAQGRLRKAPEKISELAERRKGGTS